MILDAGWNQFQQLGTHALGSNTFADTDDHVAFAGCRNEAIESLAQSSEVEVEP